jgi:ABC-type Fe3+ transport system permease subunit
MFRRLVHDSLPPTLLVALLSFLTAYPLAMLVYGSLHTTAPGAAGTFNLAWTGLTGRPEPLVNVYSYGGVVWHMMQYSTPFLFLLIVGALKSMDPALEESSRVHGAAWWTTFRRILLALAWPAFAVGWILIFFIILRELSASILLYSVGHEVLPVVVMRMWTEGKAGQVSVIALVMLALVFVFRFGERRLVRTHLGWS